MIYKTLKIQLRIEQYEPNLKPGVNAGGHVLRKRRHFRKDFVHNKQFSKI